MTKRGPRGDIDAAKIMAAADALLLERASLNAVSLRAVATKAGITANAMYTYFPSLAALWHDLADERLANLRPRELLEIDCRHCALFELLRRALELAATPGTLMLLRAQPVLGFNSFVLSETIMELTEHSAIGPRNAHDLVVGWFYGSSMLVADGWTSGTDDIRASSALEQFPRIANREPSNPKLQVDAMLSGLGLACSRKSAST